MSNNEFYTHKRSDTIKWIIAFTLIAVLLAGMIGAWVVLWDDKPVDEDPVQEQEQQTVVTDGEGNAMESGKVYAMPMNMVFATTAAEASNASGGIKLKATVKPESAGNKNVDWSVAFVNPSSSWASGKNVADYITVTPESDGALIATVNCLKAFGEQIKITVTSRANPLAKAECTLDYARRILDTALYHEGMDTNILDFGSDEILVDMVIPSYDEFLAEMDGEGELWVGGYYQTFIGDYHLTPDDISDPLASWADVYLEQTYKFSDYTIKDCMIVVSETDKQYEVEFESVCEVPKGIQEIVYNFAIATNEGQIFTYDQIASSREMRFGNNPILMLIDMLTGYGGIGMSDFNEEIYLRYTEMFVEWIQENPDTPIIEYSLTITGKYSSFTRNYSFRFNPDTVEMPVFSLELDQSTLVV